MRRIHEWTQFFQLQEKLYTKKPVYIIRYFMIYKDQMTPIMREVYKFNPTQKLVPYKWTLAILSCLTGVTLNLCYNKYFFDEQFVRDPGCPQQIEMPFVYCLYRLFWYELFCIAHGHPLDRFRDGDFVNAKIRADHYEYYQKNRDSTFDFMQLGELEQFDLE
ncbi:unnamed protein product [Paramecium pentaurelia]|uniref:Uncharacterized protein n=1 Tax=Paramecium pentaurelia TaxID=43138 RepID=A0A8S1TH16_9CILI|nr:unnamed protein product [Paramecium pentaurelia]